MKTLFKNTSLAILLATSLLSCSKEDVTLSLAEPSAALNSFNPNGNTASQENFIITDRAFIPCGNNGNGEWVFISGKGQLNPHSQGIQAYQVTLTEFSVTGEKTGEVYSFSQNRVYNLNAEKEFNLSVFSNKGNSVNLKIRLDEQNATGSRGFVTLIRVSC